MEKKTERNFLLRSILLRDPLLRAVCRYEDYCVKYDSDSMTAISMNSEFKECQCCMEHVTINMQWNGCVTYPNTCFCVGCVQRFLEAEILDAKMTPDGHVRCICGNCSKTFCRSDILGMLSDAMIERYERHLNNLAVQMDPLCRWCPRPNCGAVVRLEGKCSKRAECPKCHIKFCATCSGCHNAFLPCNMAADYEFQNWKASTQQGCKRCPNCRFYIEKAQGCNHMTCFQCRHQFCWICLSEWKGRCTSTKEYCSLVGLVDHPNWGKSVPTRVLRKTAAVPVVLVGAGVAAAAAGAATGLAVVAVGLGVVITPFFAVYRLSQKISITREGIRWKARAVTLSAHLGTAQRLCQGVKIHIPMWGAEDLHNRFGDIEGSLGYPGRFVEDIYIAYAQDLIIDGSMHEAVLYFVPNTASVETIERLIPNDMHIIQLNVPPYFPTSPRSARAIKHILMQTLQQSLIA